LLVAPMNFRPWDSSSASSSSCRTMYSISSAPVLPCHVKVQLSQQRFRVARRCFLCYAIFAGQLSSILFTRSLHARFLILAHLTTTWICRRCCGYLCQEFHPAECCRWCTSIFTRVFPFFIFLKEHGLVFYPVYLNVLPP
jgi:hypothetical protein